MQKDTFIILHNPSNHFLKWELWCKGKRKEMTVVGYILDKEKVQRMSAWRTKQKAEEVAKYWEQLQQFRGEQNV
jgi:hypothetical protein